MATSISAFDPKEASPLIKAKRRGRMASRPDGAISSASRRGPLSEYQSGNLRIGCDALARGPLQNPLARCLRIHHGDDDQGRLSAQGQSGNHRNKSDGIALHPARHKIARHGYAKRQDFRYGSRKPGPLGNPRLAQNLGHQSSASELRARCKRRSFCFRRSPG